MKVMKMHLRIITIPNDGKHPKRAEGMLDLGIIRNANIWIENGKIVKITERCHREWMRK
jgi:hypothetical protein